MCNWYCRYPVCSTSDIAPENAPHQLRVLVAAVAEHWALSPLRPVVDRQPLAQALVDAVVACLTLGLREPRQVHSTASCLLYAYHML